MIYTCPCLDCDADLEPDGLGALWCPRCEHTVTDPQLLRDTDE